MIPDALKEFTRKDGQTITDVIKYLITELAATLRSLRSTLLKLQFTDNFECFELELSIPALTELPIRNLLRDKPVSKWVMVRKNEAALSVCDGDSDWNINYVYLKNTHATDTAEFTVLFFR